jgi:hypothetical protein
MGRTLYHWGNIEREDLQYKNWQNLNKSVYIFMNGFHFKIVILMMYAG